MTKQSENKKGTVTSTTTKTNGKITTMDFSEILKIGNDVISRKQGNKKSVYKAEIFTGLSDREKKSARVKLRRKLSAFVGEFLASGKNPEKLNVLRKAWAEYSQAIYTDVNHIYDGNTDTENIETYKKFLMAMNAK